MHCLIQSHSGMENKSLFFFFPLNFQICGVADKPDVQHMSRQCIFFPKLRLQSSLCSWFQFSLCPRISTQLLWVILESKGNERKGIPVTLSAAGDHGLIGVGGDLWSSSPFPWPSPSTPECICRNPIDWKIPPPLFKWQSHFVRVACHQQCQLILAAAALLMHCLICCWQPVIYVPGRSQPC